MEGKIMERKKCGNCSYFVQHYGLGDRSFYRLYCGHCTRFAPKGRKPDTQACEHFVAGEADADRFVTGEYLSKELLQYVLRLKLLPEHEKESKQFER